MLSPDRSLPALGPTPFFASLQPQTRLWLWLFILITIMVLPVTKLWGSGGGGALVALWLWGAQLRGPNLRQPLLLGLLLFLPVFFFLPWTGQATESTQYLGITLRVDAWHAPYAVAFRGISTLLLAWGLMQTTTEAELSAALRTLPLPRLFILMAQQSLRWTGTLHRETRTMAKAYALRTCRRGLSQRWQLLRAWPTLWLSRVLRRADQVALAMTLRGYQGELLDDAPTHLNRRDKLLLAAAGATLLIASGLRFL